VVDEASAQAILEPYFVAAREEFLQFCIAKELGSEIRQTKFACSEEVRDSERHYAGTTLDGRFIIASTELADKPEDVVAAIFAHEFGHVVDHLYPGRFLVDDVDELILFQEQDFDPNDKQAAQSRVARVRQWEAREEFQIELTADLIVEAAIGHRIGYSGPCMLQGFNRGVRRPKDLR
jgi:hypothetical protein